MHRPPARRLAGALAAALLAAAALAARDPPPVPPGGPFAFADAGLGDLAAGLRAHGAAWGDADGDGWPDLFVATFHNQGSRPGLFLRNDRGTFRPDPQEHLKTTGIGSGALFVDLANAGRPDLYVSNCAYGRGDVAKVPSYLFRNDGGGRFTDVSAGSGACPPDYHGRGLAALDYDGDGLLDLVACEQYYSAAVRTGPRLFRNRGGHRFDDVSKAAGLPQGYGGLGVAAADVNGDGRPDLFLTGGTGDNRLYLNDGKGGFREAPGSREVFRWANASPNDPPAGVCVADVNRDGLPDVLVGHHFKHPWTTPVSVRLYLHRGVTDGVPRFEDVTAAAGLAPLPMKAPHVEVQDFDNDGWPDLLLSVVKFAGGKPHPVIYRNLGAAGGVPRFRADAWAVNDFPTPADLTARRAAALFTRDTRVNRVVYAAAAPTCDYNRDGRVDVFLANWWADAPSLLLRNETPGGHWLAVRVEGAGGVNRMGVGAVVRVYRAGNGGQPAALLGAREIAVGYGYCSGQEAAAHFGLGAEPVVDVEVVLPHGKGTVVRPNVRADQRLTVTP